MVLAWPWRRAARRWRIAAGLPRPCCCSSCRRRRLPSLCCAGAPATNWRRWPASAPPRAMPSATPFLPRWSSSMLETTIAGSLPKPAWLAEPRMLWAPWRLDGEALREGKRDATLVALKQQEAAGIDIVSDGEQSRQHFVHGFLEFVDGIDFARKVEMGIRADRYKAMVPTVTGALGLKGRVHAAEARHARAHTARRLKIT